MIRTVVLAAIFAFGGVAYAQSAGTTAVEGAATASPDEMRAFAAQAVEDIKAAAREVAKLTETARKEGDAGVLDCLTPRNVSMQALVQVAVGGAQKMGEALDAGDRDRANFEYRKVAVSLDKANAIKGEANNCLGGEGGRGDGNIDVTGQVGDDLDTVDNDEIDDMDIGSDSPSISAFEDEQN